MAKIRRAEKREMPALNTSSLPDIIFMLLFFFMTVTSMKEVSYKVEIKIPEATELTKLEQKSLVKHIYIGTPLKQYQAEYGQASRIQINDAFVEANHVGRRIDEVRSTMTRDQEQMIVSLKADKNTKMGVITDVKQELRRVGALKINYSATARDSYSN